MWNNSFTAIIEAEYLLSIFILCVVICDIYISS